MFYKSTKRFSIVIVMAVDNLSQKFESAEYCTYKCCQSLFYYDVF